MKTGRNNFDEQIRAALEGLENVPQPADWADFAEQLEAAEQADATPTDDALLDSMVLAGLASLEVDFDPSSWDALQEKMTVEEGIEDAQIDDLARQSLDNYEAPYQKSHWEVMAERLEEEFSLRRKLYKYKVLELALMLLFIFTMINFLPFGTNKFEELKVFNFEIFKNNSDNKTPLFNNESEKNAIQNKGKDAFENEGKRATNQSIPIADNDNLNAEQNTETKQLMAGNVSPNTWQNTVSPPVRTPQTIPAELPTIKKEIASNNSNIIYIGSKKGKSFQASLSKDKNENATREMQAALELLDLPKVELLNFNHVLPSMILVADKEKVSIQFSMVGNFEANYIFSPYNEELGSSQDTTLGLGYGGGILGGFKRGKWGFETGGIYNHKSYPPNFINQFNPNNDRNVLESEFFQDIQLDILQIPINVQYFVIDRPKWRVYVSSGVSINLLLTPVYQISETRAALVAPAPLAPPGGEPDKSLKNKTEFPTGILAGGNLRENSYLTAQFGLGIERSVGSRWSIFAQPNYQHYLSKNGLKPFKDKFYTLSLSLGTRVTIK
ncbi:MAG: hypothetical protein ACI9XO_002035 [Paraglaciecola sp.]|jgi:hypothetical protein